MRLGKFTLYGLAVIGGAYLFIVTYFFLFSSSSSVLLRSVISPDHQWVAELLLEQPKSSSTQSISLWLYRVDTPNKKAGAVLTDATLTDIQLTWRTNKQLEVVYPSSLVVTNAPPYLDGVAVLYTPRTVH